MIPPPEPRLTRIAAYSIAVALVASTGSAVLGVRLRDERARVEQLRARMEHVETELDDLRRRLTGSGGGILDEIAAAVAKLRGLGFKRSVAAEVLTPAQLRQRVMSQIEEDNPKGELDATTKVLRTLGLLRANDDLFRILRDVQGEQVGGYYDPEDKTMVVGGDTKSPTPLQRVLLAHEYTHALTDQYFDLGRAQKLFKEERDDEALAFLSLIEGDATLLMGEYARQALTDGEKNELGVEAGRITTEKLDAAPRVVRASLLFPYEEGVRFVRALFERGGNGEIDRAYRDPPSSTEQIIHPERYFSRRDDPTAVVLPDLSRHLGTGWKTLDDGGAGELDIRIILDQFLPETEANDAAAGWDGGRYVATESGEDVVVAILTAWDSRGQAEEATEAFERWLPERYGDRGSEERIPVADGRAWESPSGAAETVRAGDRVLVILGPDIATIEAARGAFDGF